MHSLPAFLPKRKPLRKARGHDEAGTVPVLKFLALHRVHVDPEARERFPTNGAHLGGRLGATTASRGGRGILLLFGRGTLCEGITKLTWGTVRLAPVHSKLIVTLCAGVCGDYYSCKNKYRV